MLQVALVTFVALDLWLRRLARPERRNLEELYPPMGRSPREGFDADRRAA